MTPSIPSMISSNTPICEKSCISTNSSREACCGLAAFICSPFCLERVAARTARPRANRLSTTWAPMKPVAPVTRMCLGLVKGLLGLGSWKLTLGLTVTFLWFVGRMCKVKVWLSAVCVCNRLISDAGITEIRR